ncbi:MAG: sigma 54-interacting transcriptional regulator, partial [Pseudomonadota bacterium]
LLAPESRRLLVEDLRPLLRRTGVLRTVHVSLQRRGGRLVETSVSSVARYRPDGGVAYVFSVFTEVGDQVGALHRYRRLYRRSPTMLHAFDENEKIVEVSDQWLRRMGYRRSEVIGQSALSFYSEATRRDLEAGRLSRFSELDDFTNARRQMVRSDGRIMEVLCSATVDRDLQGNPVKVLIASKDITELNESRRRLEAALKENARLKDALENERDYLREEAQVAMNFGQIVGSSAPLRRLLHAIDAVAATPAAVLISGESGTGKELVAHAIHQRSERAAKPLVRVNCASVPAELFESEFFGHIKGAFTGAHRDRVGRFQLADGGTLFLDEVGEIPIELQPKLLRVLQEGEFERVGENQTRKVDVRVIAATNRDLKQQVAEGAFREDLYYRLSVFPLEVPPLRERGDDLTALAIHFIGQISADLGREPPALTKADADVLHGYHWPGNVRELRNVLERAVILSSGNRLRLDLPVSPEIAGGATMPETTAEPAAPEPVFVTDAEFRQREQDNLVAALRYANWRVSGPGGAAELLGIHPSTLTSRIRKWALDIPALKRGRPQLADPAAAAARVNPPHEVY